MLPKAKRVPHAMTLHGDTRIDNYFWLRDDERSQPAVLDYLREENAYGKAVMDTQRSLQERVRVRVSDRPGAGNAARPGRRIGQALNPRGSA